MADAADARRRAEEALRYDHDHANSPEVRRRLRGAVEALLAAGPGAKAPPCDAVREAAERLWHSLTPPRSTTDDGMLLVRAEDVEAVLRALASSPAAPAKDEVREAAERLVHKIDEVNASTAYIGIWDFAAQHGIRYDGPRFVGELDALRAALSRPAAKGGE